MLCITILILVNTNASGLRKEQVWWERGDDVTSMHELTHICKWKLLIIFPETGYPADNLRFCLCWCLRTLKKMDSGDVCISLAKQPYIVSIDNAPLKLRRFGFDVFYLYISLLNVSLPSYILPLLHTWAYFAFLNLLKKALEKACGVQRTCLHGWDVL